MRDTSRRECGDNHTLSDTPICLCFGSDVVAAMRRGSERAPVPTKRVRGVVTRLHAVLGGRETEPYVEPRQVCGTDKQSIIRAERLCNPTMVAFESRQVYEREGVSLKGYKETGKGESAIDRGCEVGFRKFAVQLAPVQHKYNRQWQTT